MSLAEQLLINDREIQARKDLLDFGDDDVDLLKEQLPIVTEHLDHIVDCFYERQLEFREIALVIGDAETLQRLRGSMRHYIIELFEGYYDAEYVNKRLRIGKVHQRIGVSPKLYVSGLALLQSILMDFLFSKAKEGENPHRVNDQRSALRKLLMFDMQLVFDTYISTLLAHVETARSELEEYAEGLEEKIAERTEQLREISTRDELTGLYNQRGFHESLRRELLVAERNSEPLSLLFFDLNGFKKLNDNMGHKEGDKLLSLVGKAISAAIRGIDIGCRYGGDEFCVIMPRTELPAAQAVHDRIIAAFSNEKHQGITFSAGVAKCGPRSFPHMDQLVKEADNNMYRAKAQAKKKPGHYIHPPVKAPKLKSKN